MKIKNCRLILYGCIIIVLIFLIGKMLGKQEFFDNTQFLDDKDELKQNVNIIEDSNKNFLDVSNTITLSDFNLDDSVLLEYLNKKTNLNKEAISGEGKFPSIMDDDYKQYNHKLKMIINSKKIEQNFIIDILKNKIKYLIGSTEKISDLK